MDPCLHLKISIPICHTTLWLVIREHSVFWELSQLHIPHDQVRIISHGLEQWSGIRNKEVAACSAVAASALNPMKREPSPPFMSEEGLQLS